MNSNKIRIVIILLLFLALFVIGSFVVLPKVSEMLGEETNPTIETSADDVLLPVVPTTTLPVETTQETTAPTTTPTTEATTMPTTEATTVPETTEDASADIGAKAAQVAVAQLGKPYQYGSAGPDAFDTSGLVQYCYKQCGISIPRSNSALAGHGYIVEKEDIRPGDAVFFWSSTPGKAEYLGIYVGEGMVVAAFNSSKPVLQFNMNSNYYTEHFVFVRRFY